MLFLEIWKITSILIIYNFKIISLFQENGSFHIFGEDVEWVATEEVTLLEAVEQYGFGNW